MESHVHHDMMRERTPWRRGLERAGCWKGLKLSLMAAAFSLGSGRFSCGHYQLEACGGSVEIESFTSLVRNLGDLLLLCSRSRM